MAAEEDAEKTFCVHRKLLRRRHVRKEQIQRERAAKRGITAPRRKRRGIFTTATQSRYALYGKTACRRGNMRGLSLSFHRGQSMGWGRTGKTRDQHRIDARARFEHSLGLIEKGSTFPSFSPVKSTRKRKDLGDLTICARILYPE